MTAEQTFAGLDISKPRIMGIVNVTPDSFSDGGSFLSTDRAVTHGEQLIAHGADILDIGGESTRPGAAPVSLDEELARVIPVISALKGKAPISIDTRHSAVMKAAVEAGADIINDVSALTNDPNSLAVAAALGVPVMLMHMQGTPETMQARPQYDDPLAEVIAYLSARADACLAAGIRRDQIALDPGIGFGKRLSDNIALLQGLDQLVRLGYPILLGTSRKSFIQKIVGEAAADPTHRLAGSLASLLPGIKAGVQLYRVHDVAETKQFFDVFQAIHS